MGKKLIFLYYHKNNPYLWSNILQLHKRVIKGTKVIAVNKECNQGRKTRHGKQIYTTRNIK